jgi:hypothetical protein
MELLEETDPKTQLLRKAAQQKEALQGEVKVVSERTEKIIKTALIVGGVLAATYLIYTLVSDKKGKKEKISKAKGEGEENEVEAEEPSAISQTITKIGTVLASQAAVFLLAIAKEKVGEYLAKKENKPNDDL